jgi:hypothetical protein
MIPACCQLHPSGISLARTFWQEDRKIAVIRRTRYEGHLIGTLLLPMVLLCLAPARGAAADITSGQGFGDLMWGDTVDQALRVYPDLQFEGYRMVNAREAPFRAYVRGRDNNRVDGVRFNTLEYWFRGDRFVKIRAVLKSRIGARTMETEAERSYETMADSIRGAYGVPSERTVKYVTVYLAVIKETAWETRGVTIRLRYEGAAGGDVDRLTLEMAKTGGAP